MIWQGNLVLDLPPGTADIQQFVFAVPEQVAAYRLIAEQVRERLAGPPSDERAETDVG